MNKLFESQIKQVLVLLEDAVLTADDNAVLENLATKHLENQRKLADIQTQIDLLMKQQANIAERNEAMEEEILTMIGNTKSQSLRYGKLLIDFKITRETGVTKSSPQYKGILDALVSQGKVEAELVSTMMIDPKFNKGNQKFVNVNKELNITKESIQLKENNFLNILKTIWRKAKGAFQNYFSLFKGRNDQIEEMISQLG